MTGPLVVDLCTGRGGWAKSFLKAGCRVVGVDVEPQDDYPDGAAFIQADVRTLRAHELRLGETPFAVIGSPPCQPFSSMRPDRVEPPAPIGYELMVSVLRLVGELRPTFWGVENVAGALKWWEPTLGKPDLRDRPYYIWGNLPRAFRAQGPYPSKFEHRDPGRRSEIPAKLADELGRCLRDEWVLAHVRQAEVPSVPAGTKPTPAAGRQAADFPPAPSRGFPADVVQAEVELQPPSGSAQQEAMA